MTPEQRAQEIAERYWFAWISSSRTNKPALDALAAELLPLCQEVERLQKELAMHPIRLPRQNLESSHD